MKIVKSTLAILALMFAIMVIQAYWQGSHPTQYHPQYDPCNQPGVNRTECINDEIRTSIELNKY